MHGSFDFYHDQYVISSDCHKIKKIITFSSQANVTLYQSQIGAVLSLMQYFCVQKHIQWIILEFYRKIPTALS